MAWGAAATGTPAATGSTGSGPVAHAGVARGDHAGATSRSWCSTWPAPRATTTRPRAAAATATTGTSCSRRPTSPRPSSSRSCAFHLAATWRNPVLALRRLLPGAHGAVGRRRAARLRPAARSGLGARRHLRRHPGTPSSSRRWASAKQRDDVGYDLGEHYLACAAHTAAMLEPVSSRSPSRGATDDAEVVVVAFGTPARYVRGRRRPAPGRGSGRRLRAPDHARPVPVRRGRPPRPTALGPSPCTRTTRVR